MPDSLVATLKSRFASLRFRRPLGILSVALLLLLTGCDSFLIENALPSSSDDVTNQLIGTWVNDEGKLALVIKRGKGDSYLSWSESALKDNSAPDVFYIAEIAGMYFEEHSVACGQHGFTEPTKEDAPQGCWALRRVTIAANQIQFNAFDTMEVVRRSVAGRLRGVAHRYGVTVSDSGSTDADVLIEGKSATIAGFIAAYAQQPVFQSPSTLHRAR